MKRTFLAAICTLIALSAYGQTQTTASGVSPCTLNLAQSPAVRGVKLGMNVDDLLQLFPASTAIRSSIATADGYPHFGSVEVFINPSEYSTRDRFMGIQDFRLVLLDGRVTRYQVEYQQFPFGPTWRKVSDFVTRLAESFKLPSATNWDEDQNTPSQRRLRCDGFQIVASNLNLQGQLTVSTLEPAYKKVQERQAALDEKLRSEFRP